MDSQKEPLVPTWTLSEVARSFRDADAEDPRPRRDLDDQVRASIRHGIYMMKEHKIRFVVLCNFPGGPWFTTLPCSRIHQIARGVWL